MKGIDAQIVNLTNRKQINSVELAVITQGQSEFMDTSEQERATIVNSWKELVQVSTVAHPLGKGQRRGKDREEKHRN